MKTKKKSYIVPFVEITHLQPEEIMQSYTGIPNSGQNWNGGRAKQKNGFSWSDDVEDVGTSAGTGNSPLELPSSGKLWDD